MTLTPELLAEMEAAFIDDLDECGEAYREAVGDDPRAAEAIRLALAALEAAKVAARDVFAQHSQDAPTAPAQPATDTTGDTETTGGTEGLTGAMGALRDRIASALTTACPEHPHCTRQTLAVFHAVLPMLGELEHRAEQAEAELLTEGQRHVAQLGELRDRIKALTEQAEKVATRADQAEAAIAKHRDYLDRNFRQWCSPYGVAADYATKLIAQLDALTDQDGPCSGS